MSEENYVKGKFSAEAAAAAERFFAYKKEHPERIPFEKKTPLQQRMQVEGEIQENGHVSEETALALLKDENLTAPHRASLQADLVKARAAKPSQGD